MGGTESKCGNCGSLRAVVEDGEYEGLCESCARRKHQQAEEELSRIQKSNELERKIKSDELEAKKRAAELKYLEEKRRIERENQQKSDEHAVKAALDRLAIRNKETMAAFDKASKDNELRWKETCMKFDQKNKDLEHRRNEYAAEMEKKEKEQQLALKKRGEEQRLRQEDKKADQSREQDLEAHQLKLRLEEEQQKFDQTITDKKTNAQIAIDKEIGSRVEQELKAIAPSGAQVQMRFSNDANPALAQVLLAGMQKMTAHQAVEAPMKPQLQDKQK